jgi:2-oxoisovalerate dehydrogenase E1 component
MVTTPPLATRVLNFDRRDYTNEVLLDLYRELLLPRMIEEKMLILLRQNKISKWFSGIGQEAVAVGVTKALDNQDYIFPLHRNLGVFTTRKVDLVRLFAQWQGKKTGFTKGRDRSFHFGIPEYKIIGMISHLGAMLPVGNGVALASNLDEAQYISLVFSGDGGASEGDFHEALNVAAVWQLPVIFLIENNGYGLSTPSSEQFRCKQFIDKAIGYGIEGVQMDGNNILDVYHTTRQVAEKMRRDRQPVILEAITFRMRGHEEASGTKYVPKELMDFWATKDPVANYENYLLEIGVLTPESIKEIRAEHKALIEDQWAKAMAQPDVVPDIQEELGDVYAPRLAPQPTEPNRSQAGERVIRLVDAVSEGLKQAMEKHPNLILMGQDIAEYGGVFKVTNGFVDLFGKHRVRNTPLCESAIIGSGLGLTLRGYKAMVEMQFADFVSCGFNQIVNNLAKTHYRWHHAVPVVIRMPTGAGTAAGPFHSQSNEAWFFKVPGLKIVYPSNAFDAKGLLLACFEEPNPVMFFEHKKLYRSVQDAVPEHYYEIPLGKARITQAGDEITIITYGLGVHWALEAAGHFPDTSIEIIDLRTLLPWDQETVLASVKKTGKCLILHEDTYTGGIGAEIGAWISEKAFQYLDAPVIRVASLDTPVPFHADLEEQFFPLAELMERLSYLIKY